MNKQELEKIISDYYIKWSEGGLNEYEKIALSKYEAKLKKIAR